MPKDPILKAQQDKQWKDAKESWHADRMKHIEKTNNDIGKSAKGCGSVIVIGFFVATASIVSSFLVVYKFFV